MSTERKFPTNRSRSSWLTVPFVMPNALRGDARDLPAARPGTRPTTSTRSPRRPRPTSALEELRLGYVAWTRARHLLVGLGVVLGAAPQGTASVRRAYLVRTAGGDGRRGASEPEAWRECVAKGSISPYADRSPDLPWPISHRTAEVERRLEAAARVRQPRETDDPDAIEDVLLLDRVQQWDDEIKRLLDEAVRDRSPDIAVPLPSSLSATALARLRDQPEEFARDLARPMPRRPSAAARFGTRFHAWVEARFGQQVLIDPDELPGRGDSGIDDDSDLRELIKLFEEGAFADRVPVAVEPPFALVLAGQVVRGRIDAVYADDDGGFLLVDWKTNRAQTADPLQLAIYRVAWAELHDVPLERVRAGFYYVRTGDLVEPERPARTRRARGAGDSG